MQGQDSRGEFLGGAKGYERIGRRHRVKLVRRERISQVHESCIPSRVLACGDGHEGQRAVKAVAASGRGKPLKATTPGTDSA